MPTNEPASDKLRPSADPSAGRLSDPEFGATPPPAGRRKAVVTAGLILLIIVVAIGGYYGLRSSPKTTTTTTTAKPTAPALTPATVNVTATGFVPATVTVKLNQAVIWTNSDTQPHLIAPDDPVATDPTGAAPNSQQSLNQNDGYSYVFNKVGSYPYHDSLNPALKGVVVVEK